MGPGVRRDDSGGYLYGVGNPSTSLDSFQQMNTRVKPAHDDRIC
jgi:hypothetical protein